MKKYQNLKFFLNTADVGDIIDLIDDDKISGVTTNPTLIVNNGIKFTYLNFVTQVLKACDRKPASFALLSEDPAVMLEQALKIRAISEKIKTKFWQGTDDPFHIKVPIITKKGKPNFEIIRMLYKRHFNINVTCIFTMPQLSGLVDLFNSLFYEHEFTNDHIFSIFAGRIADLGKDPTLLINKAYKYIPENINILWASTRELYNIKQAFECGSDIITISPKLYRKYEALAWLHEDTESFSQLTSKQFKEDADKIKFE